MCRCKYCGKYSKNEVALAKHVSRRHRAETEKELSQWQITKYKAKRAHPYKRPCPTPDYPPAPPPSPLKVETGQSESGCKSMGTDTRFMKRISDRLSKFKEITRKNVRRALNFEDTTDVVKTRYMCEICGKVYINKHDAIIHQLEDCLRKKAAADATYRIKEPVFGPESPIETPPVTPSPSQEDIQIIWDSALAGAGNVTKKLEKLAGKELLSGADKLLRTIKKSPKPRKKRKYP